MNTSIFNASEAKAKAQANARLIQDRSRPHFEEMMRRQAAQDLADMEVICLEADRAIAQAVAEGRLEIALSYKGTYTAAYMTRERLAKRGFKVTIYNGDNVLRISWEYA